MARVRETCKMAGGRKSQIIYLSLNRLHHSKSIKQLSWGKIRNHKMISEEKIINM